MTCPKCNADGAIITNMRYRGIHDCVWEIYCNTCQQETSLRKAIENKKESIGMRVSYKNVIGELIKLERYLDMVSHSPKYMLEIRDKEDGHKHVFENVDIADVRFVGASVYFS